MYIFPLTVWVDIICPNSRGGLRKPRHTIRDMREQNHNSIYMYTGHSVWFKANYFGISEKLKIY